MVSRNLPFEYFVLRNPRFDGAIVGYLAGAPIRDAVIDAPAHQPLEKEGLLSRNMPARFALPAD